MGMKARVFLNSGSTARWVGVTLLWLGVAVAADVGAGEAAAAAAAQPTHDSEGKVTTGDRVRVTVLERKESVRYVGSVFRLTPDSLAVNATPAGIREWPWPGVKQLERSGGVHGHAGRGILFGALAGLLIGLAADLGDGLEESLGDLSSTAPPQEDSHNKTVVYALVGAVAGGILGSLERDEKWEKVPLEPERPYEAPSERGEK